MIEVFKAFVTLFFMIAWFSVVILAVMAIIERRYVVKPVVEVEEIPTNQIVLNELWHWNGNFNKLKKTKQYRPDIVESFTEPYYNSLYVKRTFFKAMKKFFTKEELKEFALFLQTKHYDSYINSRRKTKKYRGYKYWVQYYNGPDDNVTVVRFSAINRRYAEKYSGMAVMDGISKHIPNRILDKLLKQSGLV